MKTLGWMDFYTVADCCCAHITELHQRGHRFSARIHTQSLRALWRCADADSRSTLATRFAIWRGFSQRRVSEIQARILAREVARGPAVNGCMPTPARSPSPGPSTPSAHSAQ